MSELKSGSKLKSSVCDTQVMIIKGLAGDHALTCGGVAMVGPNDEPAAGELDPAQSEGNGVGKRYVNADETLELLVVKGGKGGLYLDGVALGPKQAKALPSSD